MSKGEVKKMLEKETVEKFLGKKILFSWMGNNNRTVFSSGVLKEVKSDCIIIDFYGKTQVYSLDSLISIREARS